MFPEREHLEIEMHEFFRIVATEKSFLDFFQIASQNL